MMNKILLIINFLFITNMNQFTAALNDDMLKLLWIVDKWKFVKDQEITIEEWKKVNDNLYEGHSTTVLKGEDVFEEKLKIENTPEGIFYIVDVPHNPAPVKFRLTALSDTSAVFENPEHDFPQKITYINESGNLHAFIEGPGKDGTVKRVDYFYLKER